TGANPYRLSDVGAHGTQWQIDYTYKAGTSTTCSPDAFGDGWSCTAAVPNSITHAAASSIQVGQGGLADVKSMAVDLYNSPNGSGSGPFYYAHSARADCSTPARPQWCGYPGGSNSLNYPGPQSSWDNYTFYQGAYWYA